MHNRKYSKITLQRNEVHILNTTKKLPHINRKTLSLGNPPRPPLLPNILPVSTISRQVSAANIKTRIQTLTVKNSYKNKVGCFDNQIIPEKRSKSVKKGH